VYELALTELARFLPKLNHHNRYLRGAPRLAAGRRLGEGPVMVPPDGSLPPLPPE
jgi:putative (di)nucleoside polyphosphate hydrolase